MMHDGIRFTGKVEIIQRRNGKVVRRLILRNLITTAGLALIAQRIAGLGTAVGWLGVGTGSVAAAAADTALGAELVRLPVSAHTAAGAIATFSATFPAGSGTGTWREAGLFNANSVGTLQNRVVFTDPIVKPSTDSITINWTITGSAL